MPLNTTLAEFNRLASGNYNAGMLDIQRDAQGREVIVKVNNHRWKTSQNGLIIDPKKTIAIKEAFLNALKRGGVSEEALAEIRERLGLPTELELTTDRGQKMAILQARATPLTRAQVRAILDQYAARGAGMTPETWNEMDPENYRAGVETANMSAKKAAIQDRINMESQQRHDRVQAQGGRHLDFGISDAMALLSTTTSLERLSTARLNRINKIRGRITDADRRQVRTMLTQEFSSLFKTAFKLALHPELQESDNFWLGNQQVKLVRGEDGKLTALVGTGNLQTRIELKVNAADLRNRLVGRMVLDSAALGANTVKALLGMVYDHDLDGGLLASDRTSYTRQVASLIISNASNVAMDSIVTGNYNTGLLVDIAEAILGGERIEGAEQLQAYHERLVRDSAELPEEIKRVLAGVANVPLEKNIDGSFQVAPPIAAPLDQVAQIPPVPPMPYVAPIAGVSVDAVKDFVADLVFSDDTMVADVVVNRPGETMRKALSAPERLGTFAAILKDPTILDRAVAPQIAQVVKEGFAKMAAIFDPAWQAANNNETLAQAAAKDDFAARFVEFFRNAEKLPGTEIAKFDNILQAMANRGCESVQAFINGIFQINPGQANAIGALTNEPYKNMTAQQIKAQLDGKNLNQILDAASNSDVPGQVGFFKQVLSTYFTSLSKADKRSAFAAAMRYAQNFDLADLQGEARDEAHRTAINKFAGAILKGAGPLLQKMMQGLPRDIMGDFSDALKDMKCSLAPIPRKIVQGYLMQLVNESNGRIRSITLKQSLGAASVGETFLCKVKLYTGQQPKQERYFGQDGRFLYRDMVDEQGNPVMEDIFEEKDVVVKIMRHDAERRMHAEAEIFNAAAARIPGMAKTWEGQLRQYEREFDFTLEAANINQGVELYDIANGKNEALNAIAPNVCSMKLSDLAAPKKDMLVLQHELGRTVDKYFQDDTDRVRSQVKNIFQSAPGTHRLKWKRLPEDNRPVPIAKENIPLRCLTSARGWVGATEGELCAVQQHLLQACKAWFYEALFGSGKFHGDTHSGNLMATRALATFIDFGNLYTLKERNAAGKNEKHELLRVIMGATFRDKGFVMTGFANLLSAEGRAAFEANREKVDAILDSVLAKGGFSQDIVYRLNAALSELQKLGMELPPQINCFVQSMMRLANTVTEMNTVLKQMTAIMDPAALHKEAPAPQRDELDLLGKISDLYASAADDPNFKPGEYNGLLPRVREYLFSDAVGGDQNLRYSDFYQPGGNYHTSVVNRLTNAEDPVQAATTLCEMITRQLSPVEDQDVYDVGRRSDVNNALETFRNAMAAAQAPEEKAAAIQAFATSYSSCLLETIMNIRQDEDAVYTNPLQKPLTFASALMELLLDHSDEDTLGTIFTKNDTAQLLADAKKVSMELPNASFWDILPSTILNKLKEDAQNASSDKDSSYKIDIGV